MNRVGNDPGAPVSLLQIGLNSQSHMARYDEATGAFIYPEFDAPPEAPIRRIRPPAMPAFG